MTNFKATSELSIRMNLSKVQNKRLRAESHLLKPVVMIGQNGWTEAVKNEIEIAIEHHELIKIRIISDRESRKDILNELVNATQATVIQTIGGIVSR